MKAYAKGSTRNSPLTERRLELGLTMKEIAAHIGIFPQQMTNWFNLKYVPREKYLDKLAEILKVEPNWITSLYDKRKRSREEYSNFWTEKRQTNGVTCKDIADFLKLNKDSSTIAKYFTGEILPNDDVIKSICGMFDVDYELGKSEFQKINEEYKNSKKDKKKIVVIPEVTTVPHEITTPISEITVSAPVTPAISIDTILEPIYGNVSYDEFFRIRAIISSGSELTSLPEMLYKKVDYDTFMKILELVP